MNLLSALKFIDPNVKCLTTRKGYPVVHCRNIASRGISIRQLVAVIKIGEEFNYSGSSRNIPRIQFKAY